MPEPFDALACDLARFQAQHIDGYARLCQRRHVVLAALCRAGDAPAVPTDAFKVARVAAFPRSLTQATFLTSGTTVGTRGTHELRDLGTYDAGAVAFGHACLLPGSLSRVPILILGPSEEEAPESSLTHMLALFAREFGDSTGSPFFVREALFDLQALRQRIQSLGPTEPALLLGTSLAFADVLDAMGGERWGLPRFSRAMQTGGFKGRSREVAPEVLRAQIAEGFVLEVEHVVCEYGMTELSSQFYEGTRGVYVEPPWARVIPVDPETLLPVADGTVGLARIEDLLNVDSAFAVLTSDRVRRVPGGFELLGRLEGAPARGCSLA